MGLKNINSKYTWSDGSTFPTNRVFRWDSVFAVGNCAGFYTVTGLWKLLLCIFEHYCSCEKSAIRK